MSRNSTSATAGSMAWMMGGGMGWDMLQAGTWPRMARASALELHSTPVCESVGSGLCTLHGDESRRQKRNFCSPQAAADVVG